jgi:hypothetical protein
LAVAVSVLAPNGSLVEARGGAVDGRRRDDAGRARRETERAINTIVIEVWDSLGIKRIEGRERSSRITNGLLAYGSTELSAMSELGKLTCI